MLTGFAVNAACCTIHGAAIQLVQGGHTQILAHDYATAAMIWCLVMHVLFGNACCHGSLQFFCAASYIVMMLTCKSDESKAYFYGAWNDVRPMVFLQFFVHAKRILQL